MERLLLTPPQVAESLGISRSRVDELLAEGVIPSIRIGRSLRVSSQALRQWVEEQSEIAREGNSG